MEYFSKLDHKIWRIAWPAILSNISIPMLGLIDAAILGHLGDSSYLGAVAIGSTILTFLYWGFGFLRMGTTGLVARATGADDPAAAGLVLARSIVLAVAIALLVMMLYPAWLPLGLALMAPPSELQALTTSYASIRVASAPAVLVTYAIVGWFIGLQNTRWPMAIVITTNLINVILDWLFIVGLQLASDGAAGATVVAEYSGCALALWAAWRKHPFSATDRLARELRDWSAYRSLLRSNQHLFVRTVCLLASFAFFTAQSANFGSSTLAANTLMLHLLMLAAYAMDGFAYAVEGLAGGRLGAGDLAGFYRTVRRCSLWCALCAALTTAIFGLWHPQLFSLLTSLDAVEAQLRVSLVWLILLPLISSPSYLLDGVFVGSAETRFMMTTMLFSVFIVYLPAWYLTQGLGNNGLWLAFTLFNGARGLSLGWCYWRLSRDRLWLPAEPASVMSR